MKKAGSRTTGRGRRLNGITRILGKRLSEINLVTASSGQQALELLCQGGTAKYLLALVLLDIKMPGMNGIETLHQIRKSPFCRYLPVVMLTSSGLNTDMESSYQEGANNFVRTGHVSARFS